MKTILENKKLLAKITKAIGWYNVQRFMIESYMKGYTDALIIGLPSEMPVGKSIADMIKEGK